MMEGSLMVDIFLGLTSILLLWFFMGAVALVLSKKLPENHIFKPAKDDHGVVWALGFFSFIAIGFFVIAIQLNKISHFIFKEEE